MTRWIDEPGLDAPDGHRWVRAAPDDCPACPCHTARTCESLAWRRASRPAYPDGAPYAGPCPCEQQEEARHVTVAVTVDGTEHEVAARYRLGGLATERVWAGVRHDHPGTAAPAPLIMVLVHPAVGGRGAVAVDSLGRSWVQHPYAGHGGVTYRITGLAKES